jgi:hypothetical protein
LASYTLVITFMPRISFRDMEPCLAHVPQLPVI